MTKTENKFVIYKYLQNQFAIVQQFMFSPAKIIATCYVLSLIILVSLVVAEAISTNISK
jgi:hypothetical protein